MICKYQELTRLEMEQVDRENTIVLIPLGALEQHGNQAGLRCVLDTCAGIRDAEERGLHRRHPDE